RTSLDTQTPRAISKLGASNTSEMTSAASADNVPLRMFSRIAGQFELLPDPRIPSRNRFIFEFRSGARSALKWNSLFPTERSRSSRQLFRELAVLRHSASLVYNRHPSRKQP